MIAGQSTRLSRATHTIRYNSVHDEIVLVNPFAQAILKVAPERALWGTDWPHPNIKKHMPNDGDLVDLIPLFMPDAALQRKVLVDNPQRLYGFTG